MGGPAPWSLTGHWWAHATPVAHGPVTAAGDLQEINSVLYWRFLIPAPLYENIFLQHLQVTSGLVAITTANANSLSLSLRRLYHQVKVFFSTKTCISLRCCVRQGHH